jgi:hypothetical protein
MIGTRPGPHEVPSETKGWWETPTTVPKRKEGERAISAWATSVSKRGKEHASSSSNPKV